MRICAPGPHLGCDPDCFHDLLSGRSVEQGSLGMPANALGALRDVKRFWLRTTLVGP